ncbi:MAG: glucoamylase family protein, partial [Caldimonas sp.]
RGHFFNWYDTETLQPLRPHYISTVDSGNLVGQLLTLRGGLLALADEPVLAACWNDGVHDTFGVLKEAFGRSLKGKRSALAAAVAHFEQALRRHREDPPLTQPAWRAMLEEFARGATAIVAALHEAETTATALPEADAKRPLLDRLSGAEDSDFGAVGAVGASADDDAAEWAHLLDAHCRAGLDELDALWPAAPADDGARGGLGLPTLRQLATQAAATGNAGAHDAAQALLVEIDALAARAAALAEIDHSFLYDETRHLMTIGYNVDERRVDSGYYDLLASEARLGVFVAIAQGQIAQESWFALGRLLTSAGGEPVLLSWSGSMFEYLMPMLLMPNYENTLLDQTCRGAVRRQIKYGAQRGVPWGISESGYNATDAALNYQYRAFGVPGLGLKRGLAEDLVVAPYASMMALMVAPEEACENLQRLAAAGAAGRYGLYEAIDYTASRLPRGHNSAVVRSFMAHHQGMGLLALAHLLQDRPMQRHFEADAHLQATLLLLQERVPRVTVFQPEIDERAGRRTEVDADKAPIRIITDPDTPTPEVQLLSNGRYHVMVTQAGSGYSRWKDLAMTRWHEDTTRDAWGSYCYLRDTASGEVWSTAHQPTRTSGEHYEAIFSEGRAEFRRRDHGIDTHTEIVVSPEDDIELRRLRISNNSRSRRTIEVTTYTEIVLANPVADALHPAFSKLFVQTEILARPAAVLCTRRPRAPDEATPWMFQLMAAHVVRVPGAGEAKVGAISHETDRARFLGRGNDAQWPQALQASGALSNSAGSVLDPVAASRCVITLAPEQAVTIDIVYGVGENRAACLA